jgi:hypothetical protein
MPFPTFLSVPRGILEAQIEHHKAPEVWAMNPDERVSWTLKYME